MHLPLREAENYSKWIFSVKGGGGEYCSRTCWQADLQVPPNYIIEKFCQKKQVFVVQKCQIGPFSGSLYGESLRR